MRALITGAGGFVGRYLANLLAGKGYEVLAAYHRRRPDDSVSVAVGLRQIDISDKDSIRRVIRESAPDEIYHLAGIAIAVGEAAERYYHVNFLGTLNVFEAVREVAPRARVLYVGSAAAYGAVPPSFQPIGERQALMPITHYAASKAAADAAACAYCAEGVHIVRARPFNHTGPGQTVDYVCSRLAREAAEIAVGSSPPVITAGNLDAARDFTDVRDVVRAYWLLMQHGRPGEAYNVCSGKAYVVKEIVATLAEIAEREIALRSLTELRRKADTLTLVGSPERIHRETGWHPELPFRRTLAEMFQWWQAELSKGRGSDFQKQRKTSASNEQSALP